MYIDIRVFDWVLLGLVIYMIGAMIGALRAHVGEPAAAARDSKWICIVGAVIIVVFGIIRLLGIHW